MKLKLFCLILSGLIISGCGYTTKSTLPSSMKRIHIEKFKNSINFTTEIQRNIYLPLMEVDVHSAIVRRFLFDGNLKSSDETSADLVLKGELKSYERGGLRYADNEDVQEYRVTVTVAMELFDQHTGEVIWHEDGFSGQATYFVTGPQTTSEESAVKEAIDDLAHRIVERTIENW